MNTQQIAQRYFDLSNDSNFGGIQELLSESVSYRSPTTGEFYDRDSVLAMQKDFHNKFETLNWHINSIKSTAPDQVVVDYNFEAKAKDDSVTKSTGLEYITVKNGRVTAIEIRAKK
jgi:hypothetical protein